MLNLSVVGILSYKSEWNPEDDLMSKFPVESKDAILFGFFFLITFNCKE